MQRVWNVTDGPRSPVKGQTMVVLGRVLKPGRAVQVEEERLKKAHKVHALVAEGLLYIGGRAPEWYTKVKKPPRATADARVVNEDGSFVGATIIKPAPGHGVVVPSANPPVKAKPAVKAEPVDEPVVKAEPVAEAEPVAPEEISGEETKKGRKKKRF